MDVSLTTELEKFVSAKMESGRYNSASDVVREALKLLEERDHARSAQLAGFNQELGHRLETLDSGQHISPTDARDRLLRKSEQRRKTARDPLNPERGCRPGSGSHLGLHRRG